MQTCHWKLRVSELNTLSETADAYPLLYFQLQKYNCFQNVPKFVCWLYITLLCCSLSSGMNVSEVRIQSRSHHCHLTDLAWPVVSCFTSFPWILRELQVLYKSCHALFPDSFHKSALSPYSKIPIIRLLYYGLSACFVPVTSQRALFSTRF